MTLPTHVWLLRHAETATPNVFHGAESDVGLSNLGHQQANAAADWFRALRPTAVISSGMRRAVDTAAPIATACRVPHHTEPDLHERRVGAMSGQSFMLSNGPWAETVAQWSNDNTSYTTEGAESYDQVRERVVSAWNDVVSTYPSGRIVIVTHGIVCKVLLLTLLEGYGPAAWDKLGRVPNVAVSELFTTNPGWNAAQLLTVPEPVARLTNGLPTGVGVVTPRIEA